MYLNTKRGTVDVVCKINDLMFLYFTLFFSHLSQYRISNRIPGVILYIYCRIWKESWRFVPPRKFMLLEGEKKSLCRPTNWAINCLLYQKPISTPLYYTEIETWPWNITSGGRHYINKAFTFLRGDIVECHPEETFSTEYEPRLTMLSEVWQSTMSPRKECYIYFIIQNVPFLQAKSRKYQGVQQISSP